MRTPEQTVRAVAAGVCRLMRGRLTTAEEVAQIDELAACYAEHTDVRHPLHPVGDTPCAAEPRCGSTSPQAATPPAWKATTSSTTTCT
jgi:hypothetical protein